MTTATRTPNRAPGRSTARPSGSSPAVRRLSGPRIRPDVGRRRVAGAVAGATIGGLLFGPTFGSPLATAVVAPVLAVAIVVYAAFEASVFWPWLRLWRAPLTAVLGLLVIVETALSSTTSATVPTRASLDALRGGITHAWYETLQTTSPAIPHERLVVFVPMLTLSAAIIAVETACRRKNRDGMLPMLPGLAVALLAEGFHPLSLVQAAVAVTALAFAASAVTGPPPAARMMTALAAATITGALITGYVDPVDTSTFSLRDHVGPVRSEKTAISPLDELGERLRGDLTAPMFRVHFDGTAATTDRWPLATFNGFTGSDWTSDGRLRHLGGGVDSPKPTTATEQHSASIVIDDLSGPWLPSQPGLQDVTGINALVDEKSGAVMGRDLEPRSDYSIRWRTPDVGAAALDDAQLDLGDPVARYLDTVAMGSIPDQMRGLVKEATRGGGPNLQTAFELEHWFQQHYRVSVSSSPPTGHGWLDIVRFLTTPDVAAGSGSKTVRGSGSPEQFAAAYTAMAKMVGIPARLVVGFRQPTKAQFNGDYIVRAGDMTAWPEIPVRGLGWIPMQPNGLGSDAVDPDGGGSTPVGIAADEARNNLPAGPPPQAAPGQVDNAGKSILITARDWLRSIGIVLVVLVLLFLISIPALKYVRALSRRRRLGSEAVLCAWRETCDLLLDHGVVLDGSMTVRDVLGTATGSVDEQALRAMEELVELVDEAVWSGDAARPHIVSAAWKAADEVRMCMAQWPLMERIAAGLAVRSLRPDRPPLTYMSRP